MFGFLWRLHEMDNNAIRQRSDELVSTYSGDLNLSLKDEYLQLSHYIAQSERHVSDSIIPPLYAENCHSNNLHQRSLMLVQRCDSVNVSLQAHCKLFGRTFFFCHCK